LSLIHLIATILFPFYEAWFYFTKRQLEGPGRLKRLSFSSVYLTLLNRIAMNQGKKAKPCVMPGQEGTILFSFKTKGWQQEKPANSLSRKDLLNNKKGCCLYTGWCLLSKGTSIPTEMVPKIRATFFLFFVRVHCCIPNQLRPRWNLSCCND